MSGDEKILGGPFICAALFCEKILKETDGVLTAVRIIDRFIVRGESEEMGKKTILFTILISMKSGDFRGRAEITLQPFKPSGKELPKISFPVNFEGDSDRGVGIAVPTRIDVDEDGVYWFKVKCGDELITRMPLRILYQRVPTTGSGSSQ